MNLIQFVIILFYGIISVIFFLWKENKIYDKKKSMIIASSSTIFAILLSVFTNIANKESFDIASSILGMITNFYFTYNLASGKLSIKKFIKSGVAILIFLTSSIYQIIPISLFGINKAMLTTELSTYLTMFSDIFVLTFLILIYYNDIKCGIIKAKKNFYEFFDTSFKIWTLGFIGMVVSNLIINLVFPEAIAGNENSVQSMIDVSPIIMLVCAGIVAPIIEELTFRQAFRDIFKNKWLFILSSGIIFGGLHVIFSYQSLIDFIYVIPYSILGIAFAYMYDKTDNVLSGILMHFIHNTAIICFSILTGMILL